MENVRPSPTILRPTHTYAQQSLSQLQLQLQLQLPLLLLLLLLLLLQLQLGLLLPVILSEAKNPRILPVPPQNQPETFTSPHFLLTLRHFLSARRNLPPFP